MTSLTERIENLELRARNRLQEIELQERDATISGLEEELSQLRQQDSKPDKSSGVEHFQRGLTYYKQRNIKAAISEYKIAIGIDPNNAGAHTYLGVVYSDQGKLKEAISEYNIAIEINPNYAIAHYNLGNA